MKIFTVEFTPLWSVPCGLVIAADSLEDAEAIVRDTLTHCAVWKVNEVVLDTQKIIFYESGEY